MKRLLVSLAMVSFMLSAMGMAQEVTLSGVIASNRSIDQGGLLKNDDPESAASQLGPGDLADDATAQSGYSLVRGKNAIRFEPGSNRMVQEYLKKADATLAVRVVGTQTPNGFVLKEIRSAVAR